MKTRNNFQRYALISFFLEFNSSIRMFTEKLWCKNYSFMLVMTALSALCGTYDQEMLLSQKFFFFFYPCPIIP